MVPNGLGAGPRSSSLRLARMSEPWMPAASSGTKRFPAVGVGSLTSRNAGSLVPSQAGAFMRQTYASRRLWRMEEIREKPISATPISPVSVSGICTRDCRKRITASAKIE